LPEKTQADWYKEFKRKHNMTSFKASYIPTPDKWLIEDFFLTGGQLNYLVGEAKAGKSRLCRWLVASLLSDKKPFGLRSEAMIRKILWFGTEENYNRFFTNLIRYGKLIGADTSDWESRLIHIESAGMGLESFANRQALIATIRENDADLVILDSFRYFHNAEEKGGPQLSAILNSFRRWTTKYGFDMIILHHTGKISYDADRSKPYTWVRGNSEITAVMDCMVAIERCGGELENNGSKVNLWRFGRHGPGSGSWQIEDLGLEDKNQPAATDLGWRFVRREEG